MLRSVLLGAFTVLLLTGCPEPSAGNGVPTAYGQSLSTDEDTPLTGTLAGDDDDGDPLTFAVTSEPTGGSVSVTAAGAFTYTPDADFHGSDQFAFAASDGTDTSAPALVQLTVTPVNDAPAITSASLGAGPHRTADDITVVPSGWNDPDGDPEGFEYSWYVDDVEVAGAASATLTSASFVRDQLVRATVVPFDGDTRGDPVETAPVTIQNTPPVLVAASLGDGPYGAGDVLSIAPSGWSDADGDAPGYVYAWFVDDVELPDASAASLAGAFARGDVVRATVTPFDGRDAGVTVEAASVTIQNTAPTLAEASLGAGPHVVGATLTCTPGTASDVDGDAVTLGFSWLLDGAPLAGQSGATLVASFEAGDQLRCRVTPSDGLDAGPAVTSPAAVLVPTAPSITSVSISGTRTTNAVLTCVPGGFTDPEGDPPVYAYAWLRDGAEISGQSAATLDGAAHFDKGDTIACRVTPSDGENHGEPLSSSGVLILNSAPALGSVSLGAGPYRTDDVLTCATSDASDADGDPITFTYAWYRNYVLLPGAEGETLDGATEFDKGQAIRCQATPSDGEATGPARTSSTSFIQNSPPTMDSVTIPGPHGTDDPFTCAPSGYSDADGDAEGYRYRWTVNGTGLSWQTSNQLPTVYYQRGDVVRCHTRPYDGSALGDEVSSPETPVVNSPPTLAGATLGDDPYGPTSTIPCLPEGPADPDGDTVTYVYAWFVDGVELAGATDPTLDAATHGLAVGDEVACRLTPLDGFDAGAPADSASATLVPPPPHFTTASIGAGPYYTNDVIAAAASGFSDPQGDPEGYLFQWYRNGAPIDGQTSSTLSGADHFDRGDEIHCAITAWDGAQAGNTLETNVATIQNSPPSVTAPTFEGTPFFTDSTITCQGSGFQDVDDDPEGYRYTWFVNGAWLGGYNEPNTLSGEHFSRGDRVSCQVWGWDGGTTGWPQSAFVYVQNSPPSMTSASIAAGTYREEDVVTCVAEGFSDTDGDPEGYLRSWEVDGAPVSGQTSSTLTGDHFDRGQSVRCVAAAFDGTDMGDLHPSNEVTIDNTPPVLAQASLGRDPHDTDSVMTCTPDGATDVDGDTVTLAYVWFKNDAELVGATAPTLDGTTHFDEGDVVFCRVTPTDGFDAGAAVDSPPSTVVAPFPRFTGASIGAGPWHTDDVLTASTTGFFDPQGDPEGYLYQWYRNGEAIPDATAQTLEGAVHFEKGDEVRCEVTAWDGSQSGNIIDTETVTIENSPPTLTSVSTYVVVEPMVTREDPIYTDDVLTCAALDYADADGDAPELTYAWSVDGVTVDGEDTHELDGALHFEEGEAVACTVIASDGTEVTSPVASAPATVANSAPLALDGGVGTLEGAVVSGTLPATDADGEAVTTYALASGSAGGLVTLDDPATGAFTFTPNPGFQGRTSFTFTASDGEETSTPGTLTVLVKEDRRLSYGEYFVCAISDDGGLRCWGGNDSGQLGDASFGEVNAPLQEALGLTDWAAVSAGGAGSDYGSLSNNRWSASLVGHTCALRRDGSLYCWGGNDQGQLGTGATGTDVPTPTLVDAGPWVEIAAGGSHTCGIKQDLSLWCWGRNNEGQSGQGNLGAPEPAPIRVQGDSDWATVAAGDEHTCAIKLDGRLYCFGEGRYGQLGYGGETNQGFPRQETLRREDWTQVTADRGKTCAVRAGRVYCWGQTSLIPYVFELHEPQQVGSDADWREVALGPSHYCALKDDDSLWCWGNPGSGALGDGVYRVLDETLPVSVDAATDWAHVALGDGGSCASKTDGTVRCWGGNLVGQLGIGSDQSNLLPAQIGADADWRQISVRASNFGGGALGIGACATRTDGTAWCTGGEAIGDGIRENRTLFTQPTPVSTDWATVKANNFHSCGTRTDGSLWCWGGGGDGQLGDGSTAESLEPVQAGAELDWGQAVGDLDLGGRFTCARKTSGELYCMGRNGHGQLGKGDRVSASAPTPMAPGVAWTAFATGYEHACAIRATDATLWCWGKNDRGQLGVDPGSGLGLPESCSPWRWEPCSLSPVQVGSGTDWVQVVAGEAHTCALDGDGDVSCWGKNDAGQLGTGVLGPVHCGSSADPSCNPTPSLAGGSFDAVYAGRDHTCARKSTGELWCWGRNNSAQLGDGSLTDRSSPVELAGGATGWLDVSPGDDVTCAVRDGGSGTATLWCWGRSAYGAFGDGNANRWTPVTPLLP